MDCLIKAYSPGSHLRMVLADVTMAAKALESRHLSGPTASAVLAESLVTVALLSADASMPDEALSLRLHVNGSVRGLLVEATGGGDLRGFTNVKIMNELDGAEAITADAAMGASGSVYVVASLPGEVLRRTALTASPPFLRHVLARYFNFSMQVPTGVALRVRADSGGVLHAAGIYVQRMVDGDQDVFVQVLERLESDSVGQALEACESLEGIQGALHLPDLEKREERPLQFRCRCTREKTLSALEVLTREDLQTLVDAGRSQRVFCHMCSNEYTAESSELEAMLKKRAV